MLPIKFEEAKTVLILGMGGGFDVFAGLPLIGMNPTKNYVLANIVYDHENDFIFRRATGDKDYPHSRIPLEDNDNIIANYSIGRNGCLLVRSALNTIIVEHQIDVIVGVDGGVDSLMTGNEEDPGTVLEDFNTLAALSKIDLPKYMVNIGFGTETEENLNHYRALENIAKIIKNNGMIGTFFLNQNDRSFKYYKAICENTWADGRRKSHVQTKIISAVEGNFGNNIYLDVDPKLAVSSGICFVNPLNAICWVTDMDVVIKFNKAIPYLSKANTFADSKSLWKEFLLESLTIRDHKVLPL